MSASSYNSINGQALYMYVIMWTHRHVGIVGITAASLLPHGHWCINAPIMLSGCQAVQCTNFYTLQEIKYIFEHQDADSCISLTLKLQDEYSI